MTRMLSQWRCYRDMICPLGWVLNIETLIFSRSIFVFRRQKGVYSTVVFLFRELVTENLLNWFWSGLLVNICYWKKENLNYHRSEQTSFVKDWIGKAWLVFLGWWLAKLTKRIEYKCTLLYSTVYRPVYVMEDSKLQKTTLCGLTTL